jgi:hypothetical protein
VIRDSGKGHPQKEILLRHNFFFFSWPQLEVGECSKTTQSLLLFRRRTGYVEKIGITLQFKAKREKDVITFPAAHLIGICLLAVRPQLTEEMQNGFTRRTTSKLIEALWAMETYGLNTHTYVCIWQLTCKRIFGGWVLQPCSRDPQHVRKIVTDRRYEENIFNVRKRITRENSRVGTLECQCYSKV